MSSFGFGRGSRVHAAVDLYAPVGTVVMAIADGVVVQHKTVFQPSRPDSAKEPRTPETVAIAIQHPGLGIIRYCELDPNLALGLFWHANVSRGQVIGTVGSQGYKYKLIGARRELEAYSTMLHLEWYADWTDTAADRVYDGKNAHPLSQKTNHTYDNLPESQSHASYERRHDLVEATAQMKSAPITSFSHVNLSSEMTPSSLPHIAPSLAELLRQAQSNPSPSNGQCAGSDQ